MRGDIAPAPQLGEEGKGTAAPGPSVARDGGDVDDAAAFVLLEIDTAALGEQVQDRCSGLDMSMVMSA